MMRIVRLGLLAVSLLPAQSGLLAPRLGFVRDGSGSLRPVIGLRANFILGAAAIDATVAAASSGSLTVAATGAELLLWNARGEPVAREPLAASEVVLGFSAGGDTTLVHVPGSGELYRWSGALERWNLFAGRLVALAEMRPLVVALVEEDAGALWMVHRDLRDGRTLFRALLPGVSNLALLGPSGVLIFEEDQELVIRESTGLEYRLPLPAHVARLAWMGAGWVHVALDDPQAGLALRLAAEGPQLYPLPEGIE